MPSGTPGRASEGRLPKDSPLEEAEFELLRRSSDILGGGTSGSNLCTVQSGGWSAL